MDDVPTELNILTLNCWGLRHVSKWRAARLQEIGRRLATAAPPPSIVALQEVWCSSDYEAIRRETRTVLPYGKRFEAGVVGTGMVILSRWPIEESSMFAFPLNGRPTAFFRGDWYAGKGVACARVRYGRRRWDVVEVFCVHTHAAYEPDHRDSYACHRASQAWLLAKLLRGASERGHLALALGDLNAAPMSLPHRILTSHAPVSDCWAALHPTSSFGSPVRDPSERARAAVAAAAAAGGNGNGGGGLMAPTAGYNLAVNGATSDSVLNTWTWGRRRQRRLGPGKKGGGSARGVITKKASSTLTGSTSRRNKKMSLVEVRDLRRHAAAEQGGDVLNTTNPAAGTAGLPPPPAPLLEEFNPAVAAWEEDEGLPPAEAEDRLGRRIDYVFASGGDPALLGGLWDVRSARVGMVARHPDLGCSVSDHFSVEVTLTFRPAVAAVAATRQDPDLVAEDDESRVLGAAAAPATSTPAAGTVGSSSLPTYMTTLEEDGPDGTPSAGPAFPPAGRGAIRVQRRARDAESEADDGATLMMNNGTYLQSPAPSIAESGEGEEAEYSGASGGQRQTATHPGVAFIPGRRGRVTIDSDATDGGGGGGADSTGSTDSGGSLPATAYDEMLALIRDCARAEETQRLWRGFHFFASAVVWAGCLAGAWFAPAGYASFLLVLVGGASLAAGAVDGLVALLFVGAEMRALGEFEWEVRNARAFAQGLPGGGGGAGSDGGDGFEDGGGGGRGLGIGQAW